jgi:uncharacterized Zn-finger protein
VAEGSSPADTTTKARQDSRAQAHTYYEVTHQELPLHCPTDSMSLWNAHPRVYLPVEESGEATCPYCGARYVLKDNHPQKV